MKNLALKEPYPFNNERKKVVISAFSFGLFIGVFLVVFQPFGLSQYQSPTKVFELGGYGLITTLTLLLNSILLPVLFPKWFSKLKWTVGKNILYTLFVFFSIGLGNLLYSNSLGFLKLDINGFIFYQGVTLLVGIIPVVISTFYTYNKRLKQSLLQADELNHSIHEVNKEEHKQIEIPSKNKSEELKIDQYNILAIHAIENYVEIYFLEEQEVVKKIIRNTLKGILEVLDTAIILQCHRSYLINIQRVKGFSGNAQGLNLKLMDTDGIIVPVSRKYVPKMKLELSK